MNILCKAYLSVIWTIFIHLVQFLHFAANLLVNLHDLSPETNLYILLWQGLRGFGFHVLLKKRKQVKQKLTSPLLANECFHTCLTSSGSFFKIILSQSIYRVHNSVQVTAGILRCESSTSLLRAKRKIKLPVLLATPAG